MGRKFDNIIKAPVLKVKESEQNEDDGWTLVQAKTRCSKVTNGCLTDVGLKSVTTSKKSGHDRERDEERECNQGLSGSHSGLDDSRSGLGLVGRKMRQCAHI